MTDSTTYIWETMCEPLTIKKDTPKLKSCPFCGSSEVEAVIDDDAPQGRKTDWWMIRCYHCSTEYRNIFCDKDGVIEGWNRRVKE